MINEELRKEWEGKEVAELEEMRDFFQGLINKKKEGEKPLAIYTHDCCRSSRYHLNKYRHWSKKISGVDTTKTNGYAFSGDFLQVSQQHLLPVGTIVVERCSCTITAYKIVGDDEKERIDQCGANSMVEFIRHVEKVLRGEE